MDFALFSTHMIYIYCYAIFISILYIDRYQQVWLSTLLKPIHGDGSIIPSARAMIGHAAHSFGLHIQYILTFDAGFAKWNIGSQESPVELTGHA